MFLLCALNGAASHLVSYDSDLVSLQVFYADELIVCEPIEFLKDLRTRIDPESAFLEP